MLVIAIVAIIAMFILALMFVYTVEGYKLICAEKEWYIETLEEEINLLEDYIEMNEVIPNDNR